MAKGDSGKFYGLKNKSYYTEPTDKDFKDRGLALHKNEANKNKIGKKFPEGEKIAKAKKGVNDISYPAHRWNSKKLP